jgi:hypothetical protein
MNRFISINKGGFGIMKAASCRELIKEYEEGQKVEASSKLTFLGVDGYDVYNITPDFEWDGKRYIVGRVEKRENEMSFVRIFENSGKDTYTAVYPELIFYNFQDPFVTKINGELILGGVHIMCDPLYPDRIFSWHTLFYKGKHINELSLFAEGPSHMKDIRLVEQADGSIGIFTRPQGLKGGLGRIGYINVPTLDDVNGEAMESAHIYDTHFLSTEWGGVNEVHLLKDGRLGIVGHIAYRDKEENKLHYHSMTFVFDPKAGNHTPVKLIARRKDVTTSQESKRPDLLDVLFTGGLVRNEDGTAYLYTGVSDCMAYRVTVADPFSE